MPFLESNMRERGAPDTRGCGGILFFTSSFRSAESSAQPGTLWRRPLPRRTLQDGRLPFGLDRHQGTIPTFYAHLTFYKYGYYANYQVIYQVKCNHYSTRHLAGDLLTLSFAHFKHSGRVVLFGDRGANKAILGDGLSSLHRLELCSFALNLGFQIDPAQIFISALYR